MNSVKISDFVSGRLLRNVSNTATATRKYPEESMALIISRYCNGYDEKKVILYWLSGGWAVWQRRNNLPPITHETISNLIYLGWYCCDE